MTATVTHAYKFAHHANVPSVPPQTEMTRLCDKAFGDEPLTREEMDVLGHRLRESGHVYKLAGWCWPLYKAKQMRRFLVTFRHNEGVFYTHYAPDRKSLRKTLEGSKVLEILAVRNPHHPRKAKE